MNCNQGAGELNQWFRTLTAPPEVVALFPNMHVEFWNRCPGHVMKFHGIWHPPLASMCSRHTRGTYTDMQAFTYILNKKMNKSSKGVAYKHHQTNDQKDCLLAQEHSATNNSRRQLKSYYCFHSVVCIHLCQMLRR